MLVRQDDAFVNDNVRLDSNILRPSEPEIRRWRIQRYDHGRVQHAIRVHHLTKKFDLATLRWRNSIILCVRDKGEWDPLVPTVRIRKELVHYIEHGATKPSAGYARQLDLTLVHQSIKVLFLDRHYWVLEALVGTAGPA